MLDVTIGRVISVIDGNTFTMQVTHIGNHNVFRYKNHETIRILDRPASSLSTSQGLIEKVNLHNALIGKTVRCRIHQRSDYSVLLAYIELL